MLDEIWSYRHLKFGAFFSPPDILNCFFWLFLWNYYSSAFMIHNLMKAPLVSFWKRRRALWLRKLGWTHQRKCRLSPLKIWLSTITLREQINVDEFRFLRIILMYLEKLMWLRVSCIRKIKLVLSKGRVFHPLHLVILFMMR